MTDGKTARRDLHLERNERCTRSRRAGQRKIPGLADIALLLIPLLFLLFFFFFPLLSILGEGFTSGGKFSLRPVAKVITDPYYLRIIGFTLLQAALSTAASILLGLPGAYLLARFDFRGKSLITAVTTVPFVLPSIIVVLGFVIFFGNNGVLNRFLMSFGFEEPPLRILYSLRAIILAHTFYNFPICVRIVSAVWSRIDPDLERAASSLGARRFSLFRYAVLPQIMPGILAAAALIFVFCFTSFAIILVLGGGPQYTTVEVEIYRLAKVQLDLQGASALAIWEALLTALFMFLYIKLQRRVSFAESVKFHYEKRSLISLMKTPSGSFIMVYFLVVIVVIIAPMASAVFYGFLKRASHGSTLSLTLEWYKFIIAGETGRSVGISYATAIRNSLFFGFMTVVFAVPVGTLIAYISTRKNGASSVFESIVMLPMGVSTIILGLGYIKAFGMLPRDLTGTWHSIVFAHTVIAYPFVIRATSSVFRKIKPQITRAAMSLGANRWQTFWRVEFPIIRPGIIAGATFAFAISMGEINATLMLYNPNLTTLPIAIYRLISSYNYFAACALGTVLICICFFVFLLIDRMGFEIA